MELEKSKEYLIRFNDLVLSWNLKEKCELNKAIETVLQALDNSISKEKVKKTIKKIEECMDIAQDQIEERIIIADSDSLNFGRKQAHGIDIEELRLLLREN